MLAKRGLAPATYRSRTINTAARPPRPTVPRAVTTREQDATISSPGIISEGDQTKLEFLLQRFKMFDVDGNGKIDRNELRQLLQSVDNGSSSILSQHWLPEEELDRVMQAYDKDNNGTLNFDEFTSIVYDGLLLDGKLSEYEEAFNAVDKSGNGTIGAMEIAQLLTSLGQDVSFEKLADIMQQYDKDESGQIEFPEFLMMFRSQLLDLKDVQAYLQNYRNQPKGFQSQAMLDTPSGDINLIFCEQEMNEVLARQDGKLVLVFAALTWCRPCKAMQRSVLKMAQHYKDHYTFIKLFGNSNEQTKRLFKDKLQVRSTPCFMIMQGDKVLHTQLGASKDRLETALRQFIPEDKLPKERLYNPKA